MQGTRRRPSQLILILRGFAQGVSTARLARELGRARMKRLAFRHSLQDNSPIAADRSPLPDGEVEADEMYQNAGEKGIPHTDADDPPRRRADEVRGHGTFEGDRPPVAGVGCRSSSMRIGRRWRGSSNHRTSEEAMVYTDEWRAYGGPAELGRGHARVTHDPDHREWARDDDGDRVREVTDNTLEGIWTGLRDSLRAFRGVE